MSRSRYQQVHDGEWWLFEEGRSNRQCKIACCDCGLVHLFRIRIRKGKLYMQANRLPQASGGRRKAMAASGFATSRAVADAAKAPRGRRKIALRVFAVLRKHRPMTADEIADKLGESILNLRPRCSELLRDGAIADTGMRRRNASGHRAAVWTLVR